MTEMTQMLLLLLVVVVVGCQGRRYTRPRIPKTCMRDPCSPRCATQDFGTLYGGYASCEGQCGGSVVDSSTPNPKLKCYCDSQCQAYGDCCRDFAKVCPLVWTPVVARDAAHDNMGCVDKADVTIGPVYMVTDCPADGAACVDNSADPMRSVPVTDTDTNVTYVSHRCAQCHNVTDAQLWTVSVTCSKSDQPRTFNELWNGTDCQRYFSPPLQMDSAVRHCTPVIDECKPSCGNTSLLTQACHTGPHSLIYDETCFMAYKNPECKVCAGDCTPYEASRPDVNSTGRGDMSTFSLSRMMRAPDDDECGAGETHMASMGRCMKVFCPDGLYLGENECSDTKPERRVDHRNNDTMATHNNSSTTQCPTVTLTKPDYKVINNSVYLIRNKEESELDPANFTWGANDSITICTALLYMLDDIDMTTTVRKVESWVSVVLMSLSLICLFIRLILQPCVPIYHSAPGLMQFNLCLSAFLAFLTFLIGSALGKVPIACSVFAVIRHWAFLAMFAWTTMLAFDAWMTFRRFHSSVGHSRSIKAYALFAYLSPLLFVIPAIIVDNVELTSDYQPGYVGKACWITNNPALIVFFMVPMALFLVTNVVLFVLTAMALRKGLIMRSTLTSQTRLHSLSLYVKLAALLGLTWVFGFLAAFIDHEAIWFLFSVLNSLQGVFLFVALTLRRKVWKEVQHSGWSSTPKTSSFALTPSTETKLNPFSRLLERRRSSSKKAAAGSFSHTSSDTTS